MYIQFYPDEFYIQFKTYDHIKLSWPEIFDKYVDRYDNDEIQEVIFVFKKFVPVKIIVSCGVKIESNQPERLQIENQINEKVVYINSRRAHGNNTKY